MQLLLPYADPAKFLQELIAKYSFSPRDTWSSKSVLLPEHTGVGFVQLFIKSDIHFFRGIWDFNEPTQFYSPDPVGQRGLIDFRISNEDQLLHSAALEGAKEFSWEITRVDGIRFFIPEAYFIGSMPELRRRFESCAHHPQIKQLIKQLFEISAPDFSNTMLLDAKLTEFIYYLIRHLSQKALDPADGDSLSQRRLDSIKEAHTRIMSNMDTEISILQLSRWVGLNECDLKRDFKKVYGLPIRQYIIQQKIQMANLLVAENHVDLAEAARSLGYTNIRYFEMLFKRYYGKI
jgi:AraC-like DNA-binding protein